MPITIPSFGFEIAGVQETVIANLMNAMIREAQCYLDTKEEWYPCLRNTVGSVRGVYPDWVANELLHEAARRLNEQMGY